MRTQKFKSILSTSTGLLFLSLAVIGCKNDGKTEPVIPAQTTASAEQTAAAPNIADTTTQVTTPIKNESSHDAALGTFSKKKLPCGKEISIPENGSESKLVAFIEDKSKTADKETWFIMDRLVFQSGQAKLDMAKSVEQLTNLLTIMKCYPNLRLKISGFSKTATDTESNLRISATRAEVVKATLIGLGVTPEKMQAEGLGSNVPKAVNGTPEKLGTDLGIVVQVLAK